MLTTKINYIFGEKHKNYIRRCRVSTVNIAEGAVRAGKTIDNLFAFAEALDASSDRIHLATGSTAAAAKLILGDCGGFGLEHIFRGRCRYGRYLGNDCLFVSPPPQNVMKSVQNAQPALQNGTPTASPTSPTAPTASPTAPAVSSHLHTAADSSSVSSSAPSATASVFPAASPTPPVSSSVSPAAPSQASAEFTPEEKIIIFAGGRNADSYKRFRGASIGLWIATEINLHHPDTIREAFNRQLAAKTRKIFWDLNPGAPTDFIYTQYIDRYSEKARNGDFPPYYVNYEHFTIFDNPAVTETRRQEIIAQYERGSIWYRRDIEGMRCAAEGLIYRKFADSPEDFIIDIARFEVKTQSGATAYPAFEAINIGIDFGGTRSKTTFVASALLRPARAQPDAYLDRVRRKIDMAKGEYPRMAGADNSAAQADASPIIPDGGLAPQTDTSPIIPDGGLAPQTDTSPIIPDGGIAVVADHAVPGGKGEIDANAVCAEFIAFYRALSARFPGVPIKYIFCDNEAQYLINSLRRAVRESGIRSVVCDAEKCRIISRIACVSTMLAKKALYVSRDCTLVSAGLSSAVWQESGGSTTDTRLDNFSSDIDILDAFEYSFERFMKRLV